MTRRSLFKRAGTAGATIAVTVGGVERLVPAFSPIGRAAAIPLAPVLIGAYAVGHFVANNTDWGGGDDAADTINEARSNELHDRIWLDGNEMQMTQTPMLESLAGDVSMLRQICRSDAAFAAMQAASDQKSEADALADMEAAVEDAVAGVEANFFDAWSSQLTKIFNRGQLVGGDENLEYGDVFSWKGTNPDYIDLVDQTSDIGEDYEANATLVNGDSHSVEVISYGAGSSTNVIIIPWSAMQTDYNSTDTSHASFDGVPYDYWDEDNQEMSNDSNTFSWGIEISDRQSGETVTALKAPEWWAIHDELLTVVEEEKAHAQTMRDTFYQDALNGDLALHEMSSASAILSRIGDMTNWKQAAGAYRAMAMPEATDPAVIELENGVELEGLLFWSDPDPDNGLPVGDLTDPDNTIGRIYMAAQIRSVPETPESETYDVAITVVDDDTDATALEGIEITVKGTDATATTDANGEATISLPEGPRTLYLSGTDSGGTSHETGQTVEVSSENTSVEIVHDGGDRTSINADPLAGETLTQDNVGDVMIPYLTKAFTLKGVHKKPDATNLMFEEPRRVEPDDDFEKQKENSERAADQEEETREETTTIVIEQTGSDGDGPGPIFGENPLEGGGGLLGLGIIGVVILAVFGIVTDAIPGLGNN